MLERYARQSPVFLAVGLSLLVVGLLLNLWWSNNGRIFWSLWLFNCSPGASLLLTGYLVSRTQRKRWLWRSAGILLTLSLTVIFVLVNLLIYFFVNTAKPITDIDQYAAVRSQVDDAGYSVQHFPQNIPPEATEAKLYYQLAALPGEMSLQLGLSLPIERLSSLKADFASQAQCQVSAATLDDSECGQPVLVPRFLVGDHDTQQFPDTYTLIFLSDPDRNLYSRGVAFSESAAEVVYWLEDGT
ncbi:MAG: hypothetical protein AAF609_11030 [Cyanobacteria bacterium P01_C01_bin.120]